jgi:feruloyl esterase
LVKADDFPGIIKHVYHGPKHGKIIMWQGGLDNQIYWEDSIEIYREVATLFGHGKTDFSGMQSWFRYYHAPGVGHCGNGVGASPVSVTLQDGQTQIFDDLVTWVEHGTEPQSAGDSTHKGILGTGPGTFGTRPICPWPTTAIYDGTGSTADARSYHCGGNMDSNISVLCSALHTPNDRPTSNQLDYAPQGLTPGQCERLHDADDHHDADDRHAGDDDHGKADKRS